MTQKILDFILDVEETTGHKPLGVLIPISDYSLLWQDLKENLNQEDTEIVPDMMEVHGIRIHPWTSYHFEPILKFSVAINELKTERGMYLQ